MSEPSAASTIRATEIRAYWGCRSCQVEGQDVEVQHKLVTCWNCGGPVIVWARPTYKI